MHSLLVLWKSSPDGMATAHQTVFTQSKFLLHRWQVLDLLSRLLQVAEEVALVDEVKGQGTVVVLQNTVVIVAASQVR